MSRNLLIGIVVIAAAVGLVLFITRRADAAVRASLPDYPAPPPLPPPIGAGVTNIGQLTQAPPLERMATVRPEIFQGGGPQQLGQTQPPPVPLVKVATVKPGLFTKGLG